MQEYVQKSTTTTLPFSASGVRGGEFNHWTAPDSEGIAPSSGKSSACTSDCPCCTTGDGLPVITTAPPPPDGWACASGRLSVITGGLPVIATGRAPSGGCAEAAGWSLSTRPCSRGAVLASETWVRNF